MNNGSGIAELMAAENRASQIVAEARIGECDVSYTCCCCYAWCACATEREMSRGVCGGGEEEELSRRCGVYTTLSLYFCHLRRNNIYYNVSTSHAHTHTHTSSPSPILAPCCFNTRTREHQQTTTRVRQRAFNNARSTTLQRNKKKQHEGIG